MEYNKPWNNRSGKISWRSGMRIKTSDPNEPNFGRILIQSFIKSGFIAQFICPNARLTYRMLGRNQKVSVQLFSGFKPSSCRNRYVTLVSRSPWKTGLRLTTGRAPKNQKREADRQQHFVLWVNRINVHKTPRVLRGHLIQTAAHKVRFFDIPEYSTSETPLEMAWRSKVDGVIRFQTILRV